MNFPSVISGYLILCFLRDVGADNRSRLSIVVLCIEIVELSSGKYLANSRSLGIVLVTEDSALKLTSNYRLLNEDLVVVLYGLIQRIQKACSVSRLIYTL